MGDKVYIFDTTLRDGEQTPGVSFTSDDKLAIARRLSELGVDCIEAGFPMSSDGEREAVKRVAMAGLPTKVAALSRAVRSDLDAALSTGVGRVHVFIATSDIHLQHKLKMSREQVLDAIEKSVSYLKAHGVEVEYSAEDATRTDPSFLLKAFRAAADAGADVLDIPDTVGAATPYQIGQIVAMVKKELPRSIISMHCHNDFGLAVANSLAGVEAGASQVHCTINGIGERAGNASLEEAVLALKLLYKKDVSIRTELLYDTSKLVSRLSGVPVSKNKPIVGDNAFGHESGIHTHGIVNEPKTYEFISPEIVGRRRWFMAGKLAGVHGIAAQLKEMGISASDEKVRQIVERVKELGDKGKSVSDADLYAIASAVLGKVEKERRFVDLGGFVTVTGRGVTPISSIRLVIDGKVHEASQTGIGPIDASLKAMQEAMKGITGISLREYRLEAITGGSDALAQATVKVEDDRGHLASATATSPDIVMASVDAMLDGINWLMLKRNADPRADATGDR